MARQQTHSGAKPLTTQEYEEAHQELEEIASPVVSMTRKSSSGGMKINNWLANLPDGTDFLCRTDPWFYGTLDEYVIIERRKYSFLLEGIRQDDSVYYLWVEPHEWCACHFLHEILEQQDDASSHKSG